MIAQRIKALRKALGKTQTEFGVPLGASRDVINNVENGRAVPGEVILKAIIREYGVSEIWLRTGEGEMFKQQPRHAEIHAFMGDILKGPDDFKTKLISVLANLSEEQWELLADMAEKLAGEQKKEADRD